MLQLSPLLYEDLVREALREDLGRAGDLTSNTTIEADRQATAAIVARKPGCLAGLDVALRAFALVDPQLTTEAMTSDGSRFEAGQVLARIKGPARALLTGERTALNFLGHLTGVATITRQMVDLIEDYPTRIVCTRKTLPGLRALQKYAVRAGGGFNHRFGLDDAVMIKDNHIAVSGGIAEAVSRVRAAVGHMVKIEVEVDRLDQLRELLEVGADVVLLDNMAPDTLREAVALCRGKLVTEASGGITPETVATVASTGVDYISTGFITHSAPNLDVGLDIET